MRRDGPLLRSAETFPIRAAFGSAADARGYARVPWNDRVSASDLVGLFRTAASEHGARRAVRFLANGLPEDEPQDLAFADLLLDLQRAIGTLRDAGVGSCDVVALLLPNHPSTLVAALAAQAVGIAAPINIYLEPVQIAALLGTMKAKVLLADGAVAMTKLAAVLAACSDKPQVLDLQALCPAQAVDSPVAGQLPDRGDEIVALFHTGGTTGLPKLVPLRGRNLAAMALMSAYAYGYGPDDRVLAAMPMFHVGGLLASSLVPLLCGAELLLAGAQGYRGPGTVAATWTLAQREALSVVVGPPTVMGQLARAMPPRRSVPALRLLINGAAALPVAVASRLIEGLGVALTEPWGLTEATLAVTSMPRSGERRAGSVGVSLPYCSVKAFRIDGNGRPPADCAPDEIGLLAIRGPSVFDGYLDLPSDQQPWLDDGWLDTGDLGRIDEDGFVWVTGRVKDLIKRGGHGIDPASIEAALHAHPEVALAAAVGRPDAYAGEVPVAYVQLEPGGTVSDDALLTLAMASITERAAVPKGIYIVPALPLTSIGKIDKQALRLDAARRALEQVLGSIGGLRDRFTLAIEAHPRYGSLATIKVPPEHVETVREMLGGFALHSDVQTASPSEEKST